MIKHRDRLFQKKKDDPSNSQTEGTFFEDNLNNMKKTWQGIKKTY